MSKDLNQCNFIGRLGNDPELRAIPNGDTVVNFSIACNDDYKKDGHEVKKTNWINVVAFRRLAEIINQYCHKGSKVFVTGKFTTRKWQGQDGSDRYSSEIIAEQLQMLDSRSESNTDQGIPATSYDNTTKTATLSQPVRSPLRRDNPVQQQVPDNSGDPFSDEIPFIDPYKFSWRML